MTDIAELVVNGFKNTHHRYAGYEIWKKKEERLLYDSKTGDIVLRYKPISPERRIEKNETQNI